MTLTTDAVQQTILDRFPTEIPELTIASDHSDTTGREKKLRVYIAVEQDDLDLTICPSYTVEADDGLVGEFDDDVEAAIAAYNAIDLSIPLEE